ncbi:hypothetical protein [Nocardia anaemiae]|uniref:hypothetical protein n=1 Tax=Nocardia anaemiae TaxID=263910 RepID=UPI0012F4D1BA|nr:hypothetical protein [Nocardia anaemiae]
MGATQSVHFRLTLATDLNLLLALAISRIDAEGEQLGVADHRRKVSSPQPGSASGQRFRLVSECQSIHGALRAIRIVLLEKL